MFFWLAWLAWLSAAWAWTLGPAHNLSAAASVDDALFAWSLPGGTVFPVLDDEGRAAGFVVVGESDLVLSMPDQRQAKVTANRLVGLLGWNGDAARRVGEAGPLPVRADGAVVLGVEAWADVADVALPIVEDDDHVLYTVGDGIQNVLVQGRRELNRDRRRAETWLSQRTTWMDRWFVEPEGLLTADRWEKEAGTGMPPRWFASVHTDMDWGRFAGDLIQPRTAQRWLELVVDDSAVVDPEVRAFVWAHGEEALGRRVTADPLVGGSHGVSHVGTGATVRFDPGPSAVAMQLNVVADVVVTAVGGPVAAVVVDLPHTEQVAWHSMPPLPNGFALIDVADGAAPLEHVPVSIGGQEEDRGRWRSFAIRLGETLPVGASTTVRLRYVDRHRFAHVLDTPSGLYSLGTATALVRVVPELRGLHRDGPVELQLGVAPGMGPRVQTVASGGMLERWTSDTGVWLRARGHTAEMRAAVGRYTVEHTPALAGFPAITTYALHGNRAQERIPGRVRQVLTLVDPLLPPFPLEHVTILEGVSDPLAAGLIASDGLLWHSEQQASVEMGSHLQGHRLTYGLHRLWWSPLDVDVADADLPRTMAHVYALESMRAVEGDGDAREAWNALRWTGDIGELAWAMGPTLQVRTGGPAPLFEAVDRVLSGEHEPSWRGLSAALEVVTGEPWDDFFLAWRETGRAPSLALQWHLEPERGALVGHVKGDLPYGRVDVPVQVGTGKWRRDIVVAVVDGVGTFEVPWAAESAVVRLDPKGRLPVRSTRVSRGRVEPPGAG